LRLIAIALLASCVDKVDDRWQLDHDHVIAARATPPVIRPGDATNLDALVAHTGQGVSVDNPLSAEMLGAPMYSEGELVPVDVILTFARTSDRSTLDPIHVRKTVYLGEPRDNPALPPITIDGVPPGDEIVVPLGRDIYLTATTDLRVNWLTSVGTLFQDDEPTAFVRVAAETPGDRQVGELVVVVRDDVGGVAWRVWPMRAE